MKEKYESEEKKLTGVVKKGVSLNFRQEINFFMQMETNPAITVHGAQKALCALPTDS